MSDPKDIPEHIKRMMEEAERIRRLVPEGVLEYARRAAEQVQHISGIPREVFEQQRHVANEMRRALGVPHEVFEAQRRMLETLRLTTDLPGRLLNETLEAQRRLLGDVSAAALSLAPAALVQAQGAQGIANQLATHRSLIDLLGGTLAQRVMTTLAPVQLSLEALPLRVLSELATRQMAMAAFIGRDWASRLHLIGFTKTFAGQILRSLDEVAAAEDEGAREEKIQGLCSVLRERDQALPRTGISRDAWAQIIVTVFVALVLLILQSRERARDADSMVAAIQDLPRMLAEQQPERVPPELSKLRKRLRDDAGDLLLDVPVESGPLCVAIRRVNVRVRPSVRSPRLVLLHPGQAVERIEKRRKWVHVTYFDYVAGEQRVGWVFSKYLRPIGVRRHKADRVLLSPETPVPPHEAWLQRNPEADASVMRGIEQAKRGQLHHLGDFSQYADDDIE